MKKPPNHTISDAADASLNVALVLIGDVHYYSDEVFIRELHSRGYTILPIAPGDEPLVDMLAVDPSPDKRGENAP